MMFRLNPAFSSGISRNRHVHQLRYHQSALNPIESQLLIKLINVPMVFPYSFPSSSQGFPTFFHNFPMVFRCFPTGSSCAPRSGDPKGTLLRGHRGLGAKDAPRGAHVARAGRIPGIHGDPWDPSNFAAALRMVC